MLAYNGSIPGPTLRVQQGSEVQVDVINEGDLEATVHWHGLRLDNRYDGTHETQAAMPVGGSFSYRITFPDPGLYWYHPHIREDYGQEMGLYGNILVLPAEEGYWPPVDRELLLTLDDILIDDGGVAPFSRTETTYAAMGRYGNVLLVGGQTDLALKADQDEVVRLYLTNTANTRVFNVALPGAQMKLVGGDSGRCEREEIVDSVILAPSERVIVDVLFDQPGQLALLHRTPDKDYKLAAVDVGAPPRMPNLRAQFDELRVNPEWVSERERLSSLPGRGARQDARVHRRDGDGGAGGRRRLRLPDASRGRERNRRQLPEMRDEAPTGRGCRLRLPDAPGGRQRHRRPLPEMRDEAPAGATRRRKRPLRARRSRPHTVRAPRGARPLTRRRRDRVGRRHGRGQPHHHPGEHALEARRPPERRRQPRDRLALPRRRQR